MKVSKVGTEAKVGVWIVGAYGDIASTLMVGMLGIQHNLVSETGLITAIGPFSQLDLISYTNIVFGGCDVRQSSTVQAATDVYHRSRTITRETLDAVTPYLEEIDEDIWVDNQFNWNPLSASDGLPPISEAISKIREKISTFKEKHSLDNVIVVNLASAEPTPASFKGTETWAGIEKLIANDKKEVIAPSTAQVVAAFQEGCGYLNFAPTAGPELPGLDELAIEKQVPYYGNDGKTGETLIKASLAPMFAYRNLHVMSWEATNLLGNSDGKTLSEPENREAKLANKATVLHKILGYPVHSGVSINYVPSLGDWKTAWDLIHFNGFMDVPMTMQFTWQGCDSILAAPLVIDMVRFMDYSARCGEYGAMRHLSGFFKNPISVEEHSFYAQFQMLLSYAYEHIN